MDELKVVDPYDEKSRIALLEQWQLTKSTDDLFLLWCYLYLMKQDNEGKKRNV